jgi:hypothetical protein
LNNNLNEAAYLIEWLENVDQSYYILPDLVEHYTTGTIKLISTKNCKELLIGAKTMKDELEATALNCIYLTIDGNDLYFSRNSKNIEKAKSGFILYKNCPSEENRRKIRESLSFVLGNFLVYIGYSQFSNEWKLVGFKAISPDKFNYPLKNPPIPPAPLSIDSINKIDSNILSRLVNALYSKYEICNFGYASNFYWSAGFVPKNIAAVCLGAAIEVIQNLYIKNSDSIGRNVISDQNKWETLKKSLLNCIADQPIKEKNILKNKFEKLNQSPINSLRKKFFETLKLKTGNLEDDAWQRRHDAAHGNQKNDYINLIQDLNILKTALNRIILAISENSNFYYDYYSIGNPYRNKRRLEENIPMKE